MRVSLRSLATLVLAMGVATCTDAPSVGPRPANAPGKGRFALVPVFSPAAAAVFAQRTLFAEVNFDHVRVVLVRPPSEVVKDTTIAFTPSSPPLTLELTVNVRNVGESFLATIEFISSAAAVFRGTGTVQSHAPDVPRPTAQEIVVQYIGVGANTTRLAVTPKTLSLEAPKTATFSAAAFDAAGNPVAGVPLSWSSSDPTVATINSSTGVLATTGKRGTTTVTARTPTSVTDNASVTVTLPPTGITLVSGGGQTGKAGATLAQPGVVRVVASDGVGVAGVSVTFAAPTGGIVGSASVTTDANGQASTTLTLGGAVGPQSFAASAAGAFSVSIPATATVGDPSSIVAISGSGQADTVRRALKAPFVAKVADRFGNAVSAVTVTWTRTGGTGTLGATTSVTNSEGLASMGYTLGATVGPETVTATASGIAGVATFTATALTSGPTAIVAVSGGGQVGGATQPLGAPFVMRVTDEAGGPVSGVSVTWTAVNGTFTTSITTTDAQGQSSNTMTLGSVVGPASATATAAGKSVSFTATVQPGVVSKLVFRVGPSSAAVGAVLTPAIQLELQDAAGNLTAAANGVTIALGANPGGATLGGTLTRTSASGVATFDNLTFDKAGTGYTLVASSAGISSVTSAPFSITAATASTIAIVAGNNQTATVNTAVAVAPSVKASDAAGAPIAGVPVTFTPAAANGTVVPTTPVLTNAQGIATLTSWTLGVTAGAQALVASSPGLTSVTINATALAGAANKLAITTQPSTTATSGSPLATQPVIQVQDQFGNPVAAGALVVTAAPSSGSATGNTATANATTGVAAFTTLAVTGTGSVTLTFTATGMQPVTSTAIALTPGAPGGLQIVAGNNQTATVNTAVAVAPSVRVVDVAGAPVPGVVVTFAPTNSANGTVVPTTAITTNALGTATVTSWTLGLTPGSQSLVASSPGLTSVTINATAVAGAANRLAVTTQPSATATSGAPLAQQPVVQVQDQFGNPVGGGTLQVTATPSAGTATGNIVAANPTTGIATFTALTLNGSTSVTLTFSATGLQPVVSNAVTVTPPVGGANSWTNAAGGSWSNPANWSLARVPISADSVVIDLAGTYNIALDTTFTGTSITVGGASGAQTLSISSRTLTLSSALRIRANGVVAPSTSVIAGAGTVINQGTIRVAGVSAVSGPLTTAAGSILRIEASGNATLTVANGFTNNGAIELTSVGSAYIATLTVTAGTLTNAAGGTISSLAGTGGGRILTAELNNQGTLTVNQALTLNRTSSTNVNTGTINLTAGGLAVNLGGTTPSFTNAGTMTIGTGAIWNINGGTLNLNSGTVAGPGTLSLVGTTANFTTSFSNATTGLVVSNSTLNGPGTITNAPSRTLTLQNSIIGANGALINQGTVIVAGAANINGALTTAVGSILRIEGNGTVGSSALTVANGFTNNGDIELTSVGTTFSSTLTVTNGTLTNAAGGTIGALVGAGGLRYLDAQLNNQGLVTVNQTLLMSRANSAHVNSGTINATAGDLTLTQSGTTPSFTNTGTVTLSASSAWTINGGTLNQSAGAVGGPGALSLVSAIANFTTSFTNATTTLFVSSSTLNGPGTITNATGRSLSLVSSIIGSTSALINQGTVIATGNNTINGTLTTTTGSILRLEGNGSAGASALTVTTGFSNVGSIDLTSIVSAYNATLAVPSGVLTNASGGTISALAGTGGARTIAAELQNQGTVTVDQALTIDRAGAQHTNSGTINVNQSNFAITQTGTTPSFTNAGTITVAATRTATISGGTFTHGGTLNGGGGLALSSATAAFNTGFTLGSLTLLNTTASFQNSLSTAAVALNFTNSTINGPGTITNAPGQTLTLQGSTIAATSGVTNQGILVATATSFINGPLTTVSGSVLRMEGNSSVGGSSLTVANGFSNHGDIQLTSIVGGFNATLAVTNGTLSNSFDGTINAAAGTGGARTLNAELSNNGTVTVDRPMTISRANSVHVNAGQISVTGADLIIIQSGSASFSNSGSTTVSPGRTLTIDGGVFNHNNVLNGGGGLSLANVTATFNDVFTLGSLLTTSTTASFGGGVSTTGLNLFFINSTINGPGQITNVAGQTMTLQTSHITVGSGLTNQGTVVATGLSTISGPLTTAAGSLIRVEGNSGVGAASLTVSQLSGLTNNGTIELTSVGGAFSSTLAVNGGTLVNASGGTINSLAGAGGGRTISGPQMNNQGILSVAPGAAQTLTIGGTFTTSGTINLELGGLTVGTQYDRLAVGGAATLGGTINVGLINGFVPASGNPFDVVTFATLVTDTATYVLPGGAATWTKTTSPTAVRLTKN